MLARLRSFRSPRVTFVLLAAGATLSFIVRARLASGAPERMAAIAVLDSQIAAATPKNSDTNAEPSERLMQLVAQRRDLESNANQSVGQAIPWLIGSSGLMLAAVVLGALSLVRHLIDDSVKPDA